MTLYAREYTANIRAIAFRKNKNKQAAVSCFGKLSTRSWRFLRSLDRDKNGANTLPRATERIDHYLNKRVCVEEFGSQEILFQVIEGLVD